ncbi:hypothetical protein EMCRGX_G011290 [Ephydatia muelleri]
MDDTSGSEAESLFVGRNEVSQSLLVQTRCITNRRRQMFCVAVSSVATVVLLAFVFSGGLAIAYFTKPWSVFMQMHMICALNALENKATVGTLSSQSVQSTASSVCAKPPLLMISVDGFRQEYLNRSLNLYLTQLASKGVTAQFMTPAFPSKTFPNHFTIVTGLYPESHGIVNNNFYDKTLKASFALGGSTQNDAKWWLGEPIWVTAAKQGLRSGVYFWPGSEAPIQGIYPTYYFKYSSSTPFAQQVSTVLGWFDLADDKRPQMMAMYFDEPDGAGHSYGPASSQVHAAIGNVDAIIESLFVGLQQRGIEDCVNVMIVSDHGMTALDKKKVAYISDYLPSQYAQGATYPSYGVNAEINLSNQVAAFNALNQSATAANAPFKAYLRTNIPSRYHSGTINQQRFGDIYLIGDLGSYIYPTKSYSPTSYLGNHGYDNQLTDMQSIFVASGPAFKQGYVHPGFENIELYNLMCGLLGIVPSPNNGTAGSLNAMLKMQ